MKIPATASRRLAVLQPSRAFTLPELMVTMAIFTIVVAGIISTHVYGMRFYELAQSKLSASDDARKVVSKLTEEVRTAWKVKIGTGGKSSFTEVAVNTAQRGNAIQIYPTVNNTNTYVRYFFDADAEELQRMDSGFAVPSVIAHSMTNALPFAAEDFAGNVLVNNQNNRVISVVLQFSQALGGSRNLYDSYQLRTKITRRTLE